MAISSFGEPSLLVKSFAATCRTGMTGGLQHHFPAKSRASLIPMLILHGGYGSYVPEPFGL